MVALPRICWWMLTLFQLVCASASTCAPSIRRTPAFHTPAAVQASSFRVWPAFAGISRPYNPHESFSRVYQLLDAWFAKYGEWHADASFLDIGGRQGEVQRALPATFGVSRKGHRSPRGRALLYSVLERDRRRAAANALICDLFNCTVGECTHDVVFSRNVVEHLLDPMRAFKAMASLMKAGGLLAAMVPWTWRYHPTDTYGDFFRVSPAGLEHLCSASGLSPVASGFEYASGFDCDGKRDADVLDRHPAKWRAASSAESFVLCYKPRPGERHVRSSDVGSLPYELHPRFQLNFAAAGSESVANSALNATIARGRINSRSTACAGLRPGSLLASLFDKDAAARLAGAQLRIQLSAPLVGEEYRGPRPFIRIGQAIYGVETFGRC